MSQYFHVGAFSKPVDFKTLSPDRLVFGTIDAVNNVKSGDILTRWDYLMEVDENLLRPRDLEKLRHVGDELADTVVRVLNLKPGNDNLKRIEQYLSDTPTEQRDPAVQRFWDEMNALPPFFESANKSEKDLFTPAKTMQANNRYAAPSLTEGQAVHWRYSTEIVASLLHYSLTAGFSAKRIVNALDETSYLTNPNRDVTYRRLLETAQFIQDCMQDLTPGKSAGCRSAIRVRLLHAQSRLRILDKKGLVGKYDPDVDGIPINQEDLLVTLGSFCVAPIWSMRRLKMSLTKAEETSYVLLWQHIGYYMGIDPVLLERHFSSLDAAEKVFASCAFHLFADLEPLYDAKKSHSYRLLLSVAERPPQYTPVAKMCYLSSMFMGPQLAQYLGLPQDSTRSQQLQVNAAMFSSRMLVKFGRYYRKGWEYNRQLYTRDAITMLIGWQLGEKRSIFTLKTEADWGKSLEDIGSAEEITDVPMGPEAGRRIQRKYRALLLEMAFVCSSVVGLTGFALYRLVF